MSFEDLYKALDEINVQDKKEKCCDNVDNHSLEEEVIICKLCGKFINNIINSPEWRYYGSEDSKRGDPTRCGMPVNLLLPKSSIKAPGSRGAAEAATIGNEMAPIKINVTAMTHVRQAIMKE